MLRACGVTRVSLGAQTFAPSLLDVLERQAGPADVRRAVYHLRDADFDNISLDVVYGIPGQKPADLEADLEQVVHLAPEHVSCYELEAKPGTRFTHAYGAELVRQSDELEGYFEAVVDTLEHAGYRWYETASFCRGDRMAAHNLGYWHGRDYLGLGIGAVSTVGSLRWRNRPGLAAYVAALARGEDPPRALEPLDRSTRARERLMLGLRLDDGLDAADIDGALDLEALDRLTRLGLVEDRRGTRLRLTRRGRFLGGAVTAELLDEIPANDGEPEAASKIGS
jgi:oxygen-independent coproporphyrinogen-3 oxidase